MLLKPSHWFVLAVLLPVSMLAESSSNGSKPPNFILLLADDLGYGDLGVTGSKQIPTPHIDSLATSGVRFTSAYVSASVFAPSRAGLMTGRHQASFGFRDNLAPVQPGHDPEFVGLPLNQTTLALEQLGRIRSLLKELGHWEVTSPNPVFREPFDWRIRHLRFYDSEYQMLQPEQATNECF
jgi:hypothetical protein